MSTSDDAFVSFQEVQKSYDGETLVVKNLNLDIARGEFVTMLGPSGSGKTTCLMMLAGFEPATHGEIFLDGHGINKVAPHKRGIGMVFQNYALFPHMSVKENVAFPLQVRGFPKSEIEDRVKKALSMVRLDAFGNRRPAQLSGGQQQRVASARALVFEPKLVLMDEPLGALDKNLREEMQFEIKHLHEDIGITMVYVTHDQSEALTMSNRIAVFDDGVIQQLDDPPTLYEQPVNAFVAYFIGENNRFYGKVLEDDGKQCKIELEGSGDNVIAKTVNISGVGDRTTLSLRPERVMVNPPEGTCDNVLEGTVRELIYLGDHIRTRAAVGDNDEFVVKIPNAHGHAQLEEGQNARFGWAAEDCRALDA